MAEQHTTITTRRRIGSTTFGIEAPHPASERTEAVPDAPVEPEAPAPRQRRRRSRPGPSRSPRSPSPPPGTAPARHATGPGRRGETDRGSPPGEPWVCVSTADDHPRGRRSSLRDRSTESTVATTLPGPRTARAGAPPRRIGHGALPDAVQLHTGDLGQIGLQPRRPPRGRAHIHRVGRREAAWLLVRHGRVRRLQRQEAPDSVSMAAVAIAITGGGALSKFETTLLLTVEETLDALRRAPSVGYRQPGE